MHDPLFRPFTLKSLNLPNRLVMAPMTRSFSPGGVPGQDVADYYARRARGGVGLIISEGTVIERAASSNDPNVPAFHGDAALAGWQKVVEGVKAAGGSMAPQLWHVGLSAPHQSGWLPDARFEGPSGHLPGMDDAGLAMSDEAIADTIAAFAKAAATAKSLGFDAVELHGAHGYLIDQFFWATTNGRSDRYGGPDIAARSRFAIEIVRAVREAVGEEFAILMRVSQFKPQDFTVKLASNADELEAWLGPLADAGVDMFHCSQRRIWEPEFAGSDLNFAGWTKRVTGKPTISVGSVGLDGEFLASFAGETARPDNIDRIISRLARDEFDLIAVGRALLANPEWPSLVRTGDLEKLQSFDVSRLQTLV